MTLKTAAWQAGYVSKYDRGKLCSFDYEVIDHPTNALMHQAARFLYVKNGRGTMNIDGVDYTIVPNTMISITPWVISDVTEVDVPFQFVKIIYDFAYMNAVLKDTYGAETEVAEFLQELALKPVTYLDADQSARMDLIMDELKAELGVESTLVIPEEQPMAVLYITAKLTEMLVLLRRFYETNRQGGDQALNQERRSDTTNAQILSYIYAHSSEKLTLKKLSQVFYMSESSIGRQISECTGAGFSDVLKNIRIEKASDYLIHTDLTLQEIAVLMGFVDASHISKTFTSTVGITPMEYRNIYRKANNVYSKTDKDVAFRVSEYLSKNYAIEKLTADKVADKFGISVTELNRTLLYYVEKNFDTLLNFIRINKACELLKSTEQSVTRIAVEVGYANTKTFNLNFFKFQSMTPSDFRRHVILQRIDGSLEK